MTLVIKTHTIDDCLILRQAKQPWLCIALLGKWRHGANFYKPKSQTQHCCGHFGIFIKSCGKTKRIWKIQTKEVLGECGKHGAMTVAFGQAGKCSYRRQVCGFGVHCMQEGSRQMKEGSEQLHPRQSSGNQCRPPRHISGFSHRADAGLSVP